MSNAASKSITIRIAIDIPVDVAETTLRNITPYLSQIQAAGNQSIPAEALDSGSDTLQAEETQKANKLKSHYDEQRRLFWINTVQANRTFRRIQHDYETEHDAYKHIAEDIRWPTSVLKSQIAVHRKKLKAFLKIRRQRYVLRRILEGASHKTLGQELNVHAKTVARILRDAKRERGLCS